MPDPAAGTQGLVVPVDIVAFCVGASDPQRAARFAGATVDYNIFLNSTAAGLLGGTVTRGFQDTSNTLEPGVHLHWALPDALTHATGGDLAFPPVPNRWLVTRIVVDGQTLTPASFVVESDALSATSTQAGGLVIPVRPATEPALPGAGAAGDAVPDFAYLGRTVPLADYGAEPSPPRRSFEAATDLPLTAVSNGAPSFASYYPESRNCFGFFDPLESLPEQATLLYVVTGWYDTAAHDPAVRAARTGDGRHGLAETHGWAGGSDETYTLYSGFVQQVAWSSNRAYIADNPTPIVADAAIGNTPSETLAAWFANALATGGDGLPEQLLTAFQQGLWDRLSQPTTPLLPELCEKLHDSQFREVASGPIYSIHHVIDGQDIEATGLPLGIATALDAVNTAATYRLAVEQQTEGLRWQVFADWYRYFASGSDSNADQQQAAILTHFGQVLMPLWDPGLKQASEQAAKAFSDARSALELLLASRPDLSLREEPGPSYLRPNDPVLLLRNDDLARPVRYGGDGNFHREGKLLARPTSALVTAVQIGTAQRSAADYAASVVLPAGKLRYAAECSALLAEAILLDIDVAAGWSGLDSSTLRAALDRLLAGEESAWHVTAGAVPSPVAVGVWNGNPWLPLFLTWDAGFAPLQPTQDGTTLGSYPANFLTSNYTIDPTAGSFLSYTPGSTGIDPKQADYSKGYDGGWTILSSKPARNFAEQIRQYLATHGAAESDDPIGVLRQIEDALGESSFLVQSLAGFADRLINRRALMQVSIVVTANMTNFDDRLITTDTQGVLQTGNGGPVTYQVTPAFHDPFNPIRAGWLSFASLGLQAIDAFGQRRPVRFGTSYVAQSMCAVSPLGTVEPGYAYAAPRIAQSSRLLFQWLSAADDITTEYNIHPADSPICGWIMPDHLTRGFFFFDASGRPLGSMFVAGDDAGDQLIVWQGAPGDDRDIDTGVTADPVVAAAHPRMRVLIIHFGSVASIADFQAFYAAVDEAHASINPENLAVDSGLTVLAGRPVALVQAGLVLDLQGPPALSQNSACLQPSGNGSLYWVDTDAGLSGVQVPVVVGDIDDLDDGLVGYFIGDQANGYDLSVFYSEAAEADASGGVVQPSQSTLLVAPTPAQITSTPTLATPLRLLMLVDPRAPVHAVSGILPTQSLLVPPDLASAAMSTLEISLQIAPVLRAAGGLALPTPSEPGFDIAYLEQVPAGASRKVWSTLPGIFPAVAQAMWSYTPQSLTEGWLRLNPTLLTATIVNQNGQPIASGGQVQTMALTLTNRKRTPLDINSTAVTQQAGMLEPGSTLRINFGTLVAQADVPDLALAAAGWAFSHQSDGVQGAYIAATCTASLTLGPGDSIVIAVMGLKAATQIAQAHAFVAYQDIGGISDGVATATVTVTQPVSRTAIRRRFKR